MNMDLATILEKFTSLLQSKELFHRKAENLRQKLILLLNDQTTSDDENFNIPTCTSRAIKTIDQEIPQKDCRVSSRKKVETRTNQNETNIVDGEREKKYGLSLNDTEAIREDKMKYPVPTSDSDNSFAVDMERTANKSEIPLGARNKLNESKILSFERTLESTGNDDNNEECSKQEGNKKVIFQEECDYDKF